MTLNIKTHLVILYITIMVLVGGILYTNYSISEKITDIKHLNEINLNYIRVLDDSVTAIGDCIKDPKFVSNQYCPNS